MNSLNRKQARPERGGVGVSNPPIVIRVKLAKSIHLSFLFLGKFYSFDRRYLQN